MTPTWSNIALGPTRHAQGRGGIAAGIAPDEGGNQHAIRYAISAGEGLQQGSHRGVRWPCTPHHTRREQQSARRAVQMHAVQLHVERLVFGLSSSHTRRSSCRWQPLQGGSQWHMPVAAAARRPVSQSVSQSGQSRPRMRTQGRLQRWQPAAPRSPVVAQWHSCSNVGPKNGRAPSRVHTSVNGLSRCDPERPSRGLEPVGNVEARGAPTGALQA